MPVLFAATLFLSATLLFLIQPMIAKMLLPKLGGTPQVWNTCMVFFQAALLAGYAYAHFSTSRLGDRKQSRWHLALLLLPFVLLLMPIGIPLTMSPPEETNPIPWLLTALLVGVGVPFFIVSTSAPLLQRWFASTGHPHGRDPYFLYGASNLGSMLALIGYPLVVEPFLPLTERDGGIHLPFGIHLTLDQTWLWTAGYALLVLCIGLCARALWLSPEPTAEKKAGAGRQKPPAVQETVPLTTGRRLRWIALAFVPSSLMLGVTTYLTTDIAAIPLLWVIPLSLYLLTFIFVFGKYPEQVHRLFILAMPVLILLLVFMMLSSVQPKQMWLRILWHLVGFFVTAMVCHGELARSRPPAGQLTEFYLWMSFGGVLGGLCNGIVAPLLFNTLVEYALVLVVACLLVPPLDVGKKDALRPILDLASLGILAAMGVALLAFRWFKAAGGDLSYEGLLAATKPGVMIVLIGLGVAVLVWYVLAQPDNRTNRALDVGLAGALGLLVVGLLYGLRYTGVDTALSDLLTKWYEATKDDGNTSWFSGFRNFLLVEDARVRNILIFGIPAILCYTFVERPARFGLGVAAILLAGSSLSLLSSNILLRERSFFGVMRVERDYLVTKDGDKLWYHELLHGTTLHGKQRLVSEGEELFNVVRFLPILSASHPLENVAAWGTILDTWADPRREAITYYHLTGPIGQVMDWYRRRRVEPNLAVIGLGTGSMAAYCEPGQLLHYFDIDPAVVTIAEDPKYFQHLTFARERGVDLEIILGDARIRMERLVTERPDEKYGLIVVDAFSSDAIPIHLITKEAVEVYLNKLADDGIIAFHISNRHLRLNPVLANIADKMGLASLGQYDTNEKAAVGKTSSDWVLMTRKEENFGSLKDDERWKKLKTNAKVGVWTDNYSNVLSVFDELFKVEDDPS